MPIGARTECARACAAAFSKLQVHMYPHPQYTSLRLRPLSPPASCVLGAQRRQKILRRGLYVNLQAFELLVVDYIPCENDMLSPTDPFALWGRSSATTPASPWGWT
ncbi:hypothetical protein AcW1_003875 [Taiwanofungus camphoratus]|nr:hypothetical protein AcW1_003875 [Antrodia cinnamomea]